MLALYGNTWASQYGVEAKGLAAETWATALSGLSGEQLAEGLRTCVVEGREFPPGAPRFRAMCLGVPTFDRVQLELRKPDTASRFSRAVWMYLDTYAYRTADTARAAERLLRAAYELAHESVMRGEPLPENPIGALAKPAPRAPKITPGVAEQNLAECKRILEPTAAERAEAAERERKAEEARAIAAELARRGNEQPLPDEPAEGL